MIRLKNEMKRPIINKYKGHILSSTYIHYSCRTSLYTLYSKDYAADSLWKLSHDAERENRAGVRAMTVLSIHVRCLVCDARHADQYTQTLLLDLLTLQNEAIIHLSLCSPITKKVIMYIHTRTLTQTSISYFHKRNIKTPFTTVLYSLKLQLLFSSQSYQERLEGG